ncbi:cytochrome c oxidase subunit IV [Epithele typhae]|uniref:cytochrome c oxidase subunit IV n=1 Tax=Epithele typhae TaxID=378194 RepID=UPI0020089F2A|nr:cytochrome c oxidase subunit IV [Epithele typhae]KAH9928573.1 cytochrome c oxidase subunit IV [Epithele typhae]
MQALRLARTRLPARPSSSRALSAAAASPSAAHASASSPAAIPLSNVEAMWVRLSEDEQATIHAQLEEIQKKDWKTLSVDEKKAAYYVAFGPHGPRTPTSQPGDVPKVILAVAALMAAAGATFFAVRSQAPPPPKTVSKEWEEAMNERAIEQKMDPIHGIGAEGYKGPGFVTHK